MKYLDSNKQTVKEFNYLLKEGIEHGTILVSQEDLKTMIELASNLDYYLTYFIASAQLYGQKKNNNN
jgi:hypothetical protein